MHLRGAQQTTAFHPISLKALLPIIATLQE